MHPLLRRIMQIHVTEEARHLCFARHYLRAAVPQLPAARRASLALQAAMILGQMVQLMMRPSSHLVRTYAIPREVVAEAYSRNQTHREKTLAALDKVRALCHELGLVTPRFARLWHLLGIGDAIPVAA